MSSPISTVPYEEMDNDREPDTNAIEESRQEALDAQNDTLPDPEDELTEEELQKEDEADKRVETATDALMGNLKEI